MHAQLKEKNENHAAAPLESLVSYEARSQSLAFAAQISSRGLTSDPTLSDRLFAPGCIVKVVLQWQKRGDP